jgi:hypothetical protein
MKSTLLLKLGLIWICPMLVFGDTVVMVDGTRYEGTLQRATSTSITILGEGGKERTLETRDVRELIFGSGSGRSPSGTTARSSSSRSTSLDRSGQLNKLRDDVQRAMEHARLTEEQRETLTDANGTLREATKGNTNLTNRELRMAMDNIRYVFSSNAFQAQDRQAVLDDLKLLRENRMMDDTSRSGTSDRERKQ